MTQLIRPPASSMSTCRAESSWRASNVRPRLRFSINTRPWRTFSMKILQDEDIAALDTGRIPRDQRTPAAQSRNSPGSAHGCGQTRERAPRGGLGSAAQARHAHGSIPAHSCCRRRQRGRRFPPASFALWSRSGLPCQRRNSAIFGMLLRKGNALAPAGMIASVDISSPTLRSTGSSSRSGRSIEHWEGCDIRAFLQRHMICLLDRKRRNQHLTIEDRLVRVCDTRVRLSRSRGSVITPVSADAAAVSGLTRQTLSSRVPERPGKFRGTVRTLIFLRGWGLAHPDTAVATCLVNASAGVDQVQ